MYMYMYVPHGNSTTVHYITGHLVIRTCTRPLSYQQALDMKTQSLLINRGMTMSTYHLTY